MINKPNIFKYATKELSQDALIFWLLSWADPKYNRVNDDLTALALELISKFFELNAQNMPKEIEFFNLKKQENNIDIVCYVNDSIIIIEDKTRSKAQGNQLIRYKDYAETKDNGKFYGKVIPIFFKTFDQSNYIQEALDGFKVFTRSDFLEILNKEKYKNIDNEILQDFLSYLNDIELGVNSYISKPIKEWSNQNWVGFFKGVKNHFPNTDWGYVPNLKGGFMGLWFRPHKNDDCFYKIQIEEHRLCLKIAVNNQVNDKKHRDAYYSNYLKIYKNNNLNFEKPSRFSTGKHMTVLKTEQYLIADSSGILDFEKTINNIENYVRILKENPYSLED